MNSLLRISDAAALALHTVDFLARHPERYVTTQEVAEAFGVSENHLSKVHQRLAKAGLVQAVRGPRGGFRLARPATDIPLLEVYEAIEGPLHPCRCLLGRASCQREGCILGGLADSVNRTVIEFFAKTTVAQLATT